MTTYTVVAIEDFAFLNSSVTSVIISSTITNIGANVFSNATSLTNIIMQNSQTLTSIDPNAFNNTPALTGVIFEFAGSEGQLTPALQTFTTNTLEPRAQSEGLTITYDPSCLNEGTLILCYCPLNNIEKYIPVEQLQTGDLVKTYLHGYRKIDIIIKGKLNNNTQDIRKCMYVFPKNDSNDLLADLIVVGGHSILINEVVPPMIYNKNGDVFPTTMIDDKYLLLCGLSPDFIQLQNQNIYNVYGFCLENDGDNEQRFGVWANGVLVETSSKNYMTQFLNSKKM